MSDQPFSVPVIFRYIPSWGPAGDRVRQIRGTAWRIARRAPVAGFWGSGKGPDGNRSQWPPGTETGNLQLTFIGCKSAYGGSPLAISIKVIPVVGGSKL